MKTLIILIIAFSSITHAGQKFKTDSAEPLPELVSDLNKIYNENIKNKKVESVLVEGHTDKRGSVRHNQKLSEERAKAAANELANMGTDKDKIKAVGKGESELISQGESLEDHAQNRRVVVVVKTDTTLKTTVLSESNERKCEEVKVKERKNIIMLGIRKDYVGFDKDSDGVRTSVYSKKDLLPDISYMRRQVLDSNFGAGIGIDLNTTVRIFGGYEF